MRVVAALIATWLAPGCVIAEKELDGDVAAPDTTITRAPASPSNLATPSLEFTATEPASFECSVDGATPVACESPHRLELADGAHTFRVIATDVAGNRDDSPAEHAWTTDTVAPSTTFLVTPPSIDTSATARFEFVSDDDDATFECAFDSDAYTACLSPSIIATVPDGAHAFAVRAIDAAGNVDATPALRNWNLGPNIAIGSGPASGSTSGPFVEFGFVASNGASSVCSIDGGAAAACLDDITYNLPAGPHSFTVTASDGTRTSTASRTWTVACAGPSVGPDSRGVLHFDEVAGTQAVGNAVADRPAAVLGTSGAVESRDPTRIAAGRFGAGLAFSSSAQQVVTWPAGLGVLPAHTIELWVRPSAATASGEVLVATADGAMVIALARDDASVRIEYYLRDDTGDAFRASSDELAPGVWHHVVASYLPVDPPHGISWLAVDGVVRNLLLRDIPAIDFSSLRIGSPDAGIPWGVATNAELDELHLRIDAVEGDDDALAAYCPVSP